MEITQLRELRGSELAEFARRIGDDYTELGAAVKTLVGGGEPSDYEMIAALISYVTVGMGNAKDYYSRSETEGKRFTDIFVALAEQCGIPEHEYTAVLLAARYAERGGALAKWRDAADARIKARATRDFEFVADCIDLYDAKFGAYEILFEVEPERTVKRLLYKLLFVSHTDKAAIREFFMDKPAIVDELFELYSKSNVRERVKIVRLLGVLKNHARVAEFVANVAAVDRSKTVRAVVARLDMQQKKQGGKSAAEYFEWLMITGETVSLADFEALMCDDEYAAVADKIFFCAASDDITSIGGAEPRCSGSVRVVLMRDGGDFIDIHDRVAELAETAEISVVHPVDVPDEANFIFSLDVEQPFEQLSRPIYRPSVGETSYSNRFNGTVIHRRSFDANFKRGGFVFCADRAETSVEVAALAIGGYAVAVECDTSSKNSVVCRKIYFYRASSIVKNRRLYISPDTSIAVCDVSASAFSELMLAAARLFGI